MKTERRHELQTNELAEWLATWVQRIKPYTRVILGAIILVVTALFVMSFASSRRDQQQAVGWSAYFDAVESGDAEQLRRVSQDYPETAAGLWALQSAADRHLATGVAELFRDRQDARKELRKARDIYREVAGKSTEPTLQMRARFGLGQAYESLGELDEALKEYQQIAANWPDSVVGDKAAKKATSLQDEDTRAWYAWFAEQKPQPADDALSDPSLFQNLPDLPEEPNISLPDAGELIQPTGSTPLEFPGLDDSDESTVNDGTDTGASNADPSPELFIPDETDLDAEQPADGQDGAN